MWENIESLNIVNLYRGMSKLKLKINVSLLQLLCLVVSVALHGKFKRLKYVYVIYQTRATVFHQDIQTPRRELKIRRAAEYF